MQSRKASIKETGEELSPADWERFDAAVEELKQERQNHTPRESTQGKSEGESDDQAVA